MGEYLCSDCDLLLGNKSSNDSDKQYETCEECYRYNICMEAKKKFDEDVKTFPYIHDWNSFKGRNNEAENS